MKDKEYKNVIENVKNFEKELIGFIDKKITATPHLQEAVAITVITLKVAAGYARNFLEIDEESNIIKKQDKELLRIIRKCSDDIMEHAYKNRTPQNFEE